MADSDSSKIVPITTTTTSHYDRADEIRRGYSNLAHFNTIPWCSTLINAPNTTILHQLPRGGPASDMFWTRTLRDQDTIKGVITIISSELAPEYPRIKSSITFYSFGSGVVSHKGMCHGGLTYTLFDEAMGTFVGLVEDIEAQENEGYIKKSSFTLKCEVTYKKPVPAPGVVLVRSTLDGIEGKVRRVIGTLEDEKGNVLCEAKGEWLAVDRRWQAEWYAKL